MSDKPNPLNQFDGMSLRDLAVELGEAKKVLEEAKSAARHAQARFDQLRHSVIPPKMEEEGVSSMNFPGVGRLTVSADFWGGISPGLQEEAYKWMRDKGYGDLIKDFVHTSTLKAWQKEQVEQGLNSDWPKVKMKVDEGEEIEVDVFKFEPFERASLTKTK